MSPDRRWFFAEDVLRRSGLPPVLRRDAHALMQAGHENLSEGPVAVVTASGLLKPSSRRYVPDWVLGLETRFLVVVDVPEPGLMHLPRVLGVRKPDIRVHVSREWIAVRRLLVAQRRRDPFEGIVDAYLLPGTLVLVLGDMSIRSFPVKRIAQLKRLTRDALEGFTIDPGGSYLAWKNEGIHLGAAQLLEQVDPGFFADVEIARYASDTTGHALSVMRERQNLRQGDIPGLSERQVRRIEKGISRLTPEAASRFAAAFGVNLEAFLRDFSAAATELSGARQSIDDPENGPSPNASVLAARPSAAARSASVRGHQSAALAGDSGVS